MCIRDSVSLVRRGQPLAAPIPRGEPKRTRLSAHAAHGRCCLLYTSDAADERSSVDLGGRRIIKKKKQQGAIHAE